jgi:hypothetical protein
LEQILTHWLGWSKQSATAYMEQRNTDSGFRNKSHPEFYKSYLMQPAAKSELELSVVRVE